MVRYILWLQIFCTRILPAVAIGDSIIEEVPTSPSVALMRSERRDGVRQAEVQPHGAQNLAQEGADLLGLQGSLVEDRHEAHLVSNITADSGDWKVIFSGYDGWSGGTSHCGSWGEIAGGYRLTGRGNQITRTYAMPDGVLQAKVELEFVKIDSWDSEAGWVLVNNNECWRRTYQPRDTTQMCGSMNGDWNEAKDTVTCTLGATGNQEIVVATNLNEGSDNEAFGVRNPQVFAKMKDVCKETSCSGPTTLRTDKPAFCAASTCTPTECCVDLPRCDASTCGYGKVLKRGGPSWCKAIKCTEAECCTAVGKCDAASCDSGMTKKEGSDSVQCKAVECTSEECCSPVGKCSDFSCNSPKVKGDKDKCNGLKCTESECCVDGTTTTTTVATTAPKGKSGAWGTTPGVVRHIVAAAVSLAAAAALPA